MKTDIEIGLNSVWVNYVKGIKHRVVALDGQRVYTTDQLGMERHCYSREIFLDWFQKIDSAPDAANFAYPTTGPLRAR
jgi:DNA-directed RNA polymerase subunit N (RpoN/RPB10)